MLQFMYITKSPEIAKIAEDAGVDRIFVDLEKIGKEARQGGMNTVKSDHTVQDAAAVRRVLTKAQLLVRVNPIHPGSKEEIRSCIDAGADILMLPYFKTREETVRFTEYCGGRVTTMLLCETPEAARDLDGILAEGGVDLLHVGLNDLHLGLGKKFMFELLCDGTVENICRICKKRNIPCGFGGVASLGHGLLPAEYVLSEHVRLGSDAVILSRSFCASPETHSAEELRKIFTGGVRQLREYESFLHRQSPEFLLHQHQEMNKIINRITEESL